MQKFPALNLPKREDAALKEFCRQVEDAVKSELMSLMVFGDLARGDFYPANSDINLAIILKNTSVDVLKPFRDSLRKAQASMRLVPMFLSKEDLEGATDVFPTKFLLMKHQHVALSGEDVLAEIEIDDTHLRLRCEQELRNLSIRQRAAFVRASRPEKLEQLLIGGVTSLLNNLRVLTFLKTKALPANDVDTIAKAGKEFSLDTKLLEQGIQLKKKDFEPTKEELPLLFEQMMGFTQQVAKLADKMEV
jgi:predicted nucleotidyltransferase